MQERVEVQGLSAAKLPQHLRVGPVLLFPVLTAPQGAHALEMPQPAQHMLLWKGNSCLFIGSDKLPASGARRTKVLPAQPWLRGTQAVAGSTRGV